MKKQKNVSIKNRKASFSYEFLDKLTCGIVLTGSEVKSIRDSKVNLAEGFCFFRNNELWMKNVHISEYKEANIANHTPVHDRKLIAKRAELNKWMGKMKEKGLTMVPTKLFMNDRGLVKVEVALSRGKKTHDKRQAIKERESKRELDRLRKSF